MKENTNSSQSSKQKNAATTPKKKKKDPAKLFPIRYSKFNDFYLLVVLASAFALGIGITLAVTDDLFWGLAIFFSAILVYAYFTSSELHDKLGLWYRTESGSLYITKCRAKYGDVFYIPSRLLWYDVEELCDNAFFSSTGKNSELCAVYLPKSLKKIGCDVFASCDSLKTIFFEGNEEEWNKIEKNTDLEGLEIIFETPYPKKPVKTH